MSRRIWNRKFLFDFCKLYEAHECLWRVNDINYYNQEMKAIAYTELVELVKTEYPDEANVALVKKKIKNIRCSFRREYKKMERSEVYTTRLWYL